MATQNENNTIAETNTKMAPSSPEVVQTRSESSDVKANEAPGKWVSFWRKVYKPIGFNKGYNFILFFIFAGALFGFILARLSYLNVAGSAPSSYKNSAAPGEWYWYHAGHERVGIYLHLCSVIPAGFLIVWQFVPIIRYKALIVHRINGYVIALLVLTGNAGALMIARRTFGGELSTQAAVGALAIGTTTSIALAIYNVRRLQIEQHRAWMLRAMFYLGTIITVRFIVIIAAAATTAIGGYWATMPCGEISFIYASGGGDNSSLLGAYPQCYDAASGALLAGRWVAVAADFGGGPENIGASLDIGFGMAMWMAFFLHAMGVEIYLKLTPRETERLRNVSYTKQLEAGFQNPGSAGLVVERWGDADEWVPRRRAGA